MDLKAASKRTWLFVLLPLIWFGALLAGGPTSAFDAQVSSALYLGEGSDYILPWFIITEIGGWKVLMALAAAGAVYLLMQRRLNDFLYLAAAVMGARALVELQKFLIARPRPDELHLADVFTHSFPSGHAANSLVTYLMLAVLLFRGRLAVVAALLLIILIGLSRILLGVHWPSDVIGGWAFGLFWILLLTRLTRSRVR